MGPGMYQVISTLLLILLSYRLKVEAYEVVGNIHEEDGSTLQTPAKEGSNLILKCKGTQSYEHCTWRHKGEICNFEWMQGVLFVGGKLKQKSCSRYFRKRIQLAGNYNNHECHIILKDVRSSDSGIWSCELEEYVFGPKNGDRGSVTISLSVENSEQPGFGYYWIIFVVGIIAGVFCVALLVVWATSNIRKLWSCFKSDRNIRREEVEVSTHERSRQSNSTCISNLELTPISLNEATSPNHSFHITQQSTNQEQLPPKYEDIESHPIVKPYPLSANNLEGGSPPKYEDILDK